MDVWVDLGAAVVGWGVTLYLSRRAYRAWQRQPASDNRTGLLHTWRLALCLTLYFTLRVGAVATLLDTLLPWNNSARFLAYLCVSWAAYFLNQGLSHVANVRLPPWLPSLPLAVTGIFSVLFVAGLAAIPSAEVGPPATLVDFLFREVLYAYMFLLLLLPIPVHAAALKLERGMIARTRLIFSLIAVAVEQAPGDAVSDPALLVGESLSVVRYNGEPVTLRHLGPAVILAPDERGIAVRVQADTGLAGLLRPGMKVGVVATLPSPSPEFGGGPGRGSVYAKSTLEDLRVLYVPPSFQARSPQTVVYESDEDGTYIPPPPPQEPVREGVVVLAAGTLPEPVIYEEAETILLRALAEEEGGGDTEDAVESEETEGEPPDVTWAVPVELLAALNAADASFTLVLTPDDARPYTSPGLELATMDPNADNNSSLAQR